MRATDNQITEWAKRHDLQGSVTDLRQAFEDAETLIPPAPINVQELAKSVAQKACNADLSYNQIKSLILSCANAEQAKPSDEKNPYKEMVGELLCVLDAFGTFHRNSPIWKTLDANATIAKASEMVGEETLHYQREALRRREEWKSQPSAPVLSEEEERQIEKAQEIDRVCSASDNSDGTDYEHLPTLEDMHGAVSNLLSIVKKYKQSAALKGATNEQKT